MDHDRRHGQSHGSAQAGEHMAADATSAGRSTLTEEPHASASAVGEEAQWEAIEAPAPHADDPAAKETIYGDNHHNAHGKRYERHHKHAERHHPKFDRYNRHTIDDHASKFVAGRPGVVSHGHGLFMVNKPIVTRYTFMREGHKNIAQPFDTVDRKTVTTKNWKAPGGGHHDPNKDTRILANPSEPKKLHIDGKDHLCVLTWAGVQSAAWMKVDDLVHGHQIAHAAHARAVKEDPKALSHDPDKLMHHTNHYVIRNDDVGEANPGDAPHDKDRVLAAGAHDGDNLSHYLAKHHTKPAFDAQGQPTDKVVSRSWVAVCMNLPEGNSPPIAIDTVLAGESFFAMKDAKFHRETPVFENGARKAKLLEKWVFGHVAMRDAHGKLIPDPNRRGWVPFRVLADAKHLETHEIDQRL
jgi:hypothetical protein